MGKLLRRVVENGIPCGVLSVPQRDRWGKVKPKLFVSVVVPERSLHVMAPAPSAQPGRAGKTLSLRMLALWRRILNQFLVKAQMQQVDLAPEEKVFRANKRKIAEQSRRRNRRR